MALQFIDQSPSGIGRSDRRIIRSHVTQGKNAGKQRRSTKKQKNVAKLKRLFNPSGFGFVIPRLVPLSDLFPSIASPFSMPQQPLRVGEETHGTLTNLILASSLGLAHPNGASLTLIDAYQHWRHSPLRSWPIRYCFLFWEVTLPCTGTPSICCNSGPHPRMHGCLALQRRWWSLHMSCRVD